MNGWKNRETWNVALMVFRVDAWGETAPSAGVVFLIDTPR